MNVPSLSGLGTREVTLGIRPSAVKIAAEGLPASVTMCEALGEDVFVDLTLGERLVRAKLREAARPAEGSRVHIGLQEEALHVFDASTGMRL